MKAAILHSPDSEDERQHTAYSHELAEILLMANDLLDEESRKTIEEASGTDDIDVLTQLFLPHAIRSTLANGADAYDTTLARASIIFTQLPIRDDVRARAGADFIDIGSRFAKQTGLSLKDYFAVGWMLLYWFSLAARNPQKYLDQRKLIPATFFSLTKLDSTLASSILNDLMQDYAFAKAAFEARVGSSRLFSYDTVPFMARPLYRIRNDIAVPVNLPFLAARLSVGVYWILFDQMSDPERRRLSRFYGHLLEAYVRDTILRALPIGSDTTRRVFPEFEYRVGRRRLLTSDVVALYPDTGVFFEVTATRLRMDATRLTNDAAAVEKDFENIIIGKARQLNDRIDDFRAGYYSFDGTTADDVPIIKPVLVTSEAIPMWTATARPINAAMKRAGFLQQFGVEPLSIIGVDELEMLEALTHRGTDLLSVLRAHAADDELKNISLRNYLQRRYSVPDNVTLRAEYLAAGNHGAQLLFGTHLGPPTHEEIAERAYALYEQRGRIDGHDLDDWLQAEREAWGGTEPA